MICLGYIALCLSVLGWSDAQSTTAVGGVATTTSMSAYGYMVAIGDATITTTQQAKGHVGVNYYDYRTSAWTGREDILLNPYVLDTSTGIVSYGDLNTDINANNGFGQSVTCANDDTIFISACNKNYNSGRVYLYKGRNAHWTSQQILNSYHTGPSETYSSSSDSFFGEAMDSSESVLAVGCRNCNSTVKGYAESGEIYIFRPEKDKNSVLWTNTQVLVGKDIYFLGGHVAMHENVIVASGCSLEEFTHNSIQTTPIMASIFLADDYLVRDGPKSEFRYQHNVYTRDPLYQRVGDVAVYDMTVAMATYDVVRDTNNVYVFYPNNKKYNLETAASKGKPRPISWSLVQVLTTPNPATFTVQNPTYLTLWDNRMFMRGKTGGDFTLDTNRTKRAGQYFPFYEKSNVPNQNLNHQIVASDFNLYQDGLLGSRVLNSVVDITPAAYKCIRIWVEDEFDDGWDIAELIVEGPNGVKRSYKNDCDSVNPLVSRYCPIFHDEAGSKGIHKLYIKNGKEAKFNWEILWRVYDEATATWYMGDIHTEMDFEWQYRDHMFSNTRVHQLRQNITCSVCPQNADEWESYTRGNHPEPKAKAKSLNNLRALHSLPKTSSPTMSPAPTIAVDYSKNWNYVEMINDAGGGVTDPWFDSNGRGTFFYISDTEGKHLVYSGSGCTAGNVAVDCFLKLDDGDYVLRVTGANDPHTLQRRWKFCQGLNYQASQTELYFSIVDGVCFPVMTRHQTLVCDNILKVTNLNVEVALGGDFSNLVGYDSSGIYKDVNRNQLQPIAQAVSAALQHIFGFEEFSSSIQKVKSSSANAIVILVDVGLKKFDRSMLPTLDSLETGGGDTLKKFISSEILSASVSLDYDSSVVDSLTSASVISIRVGSETVDYLSQDESNFDTVTNFIPHVSEIQSPTNEYLVESERIVAIGGYMISFATVIVAVVFIYSSIKERVSPSAEEKPPIKPSAARIHLHLVESSSDDDSDEEISVAPVSFIKKPAATTLHKTKTKRNHDAKLKKLLETEDAVYRKSAKQSSSR